MPTQGSILEWSADMTMLIGLTTDTHTTTPGAKAQLGRLRTIELPTEILKAFDKVDLILHAGDVYTVPVIDRLEEVARVLVSEGDDDPFETVTDSRVKGEQRLTIEGVTIWLSHYGSWDDSSSEQLPDVMVYGHTHRSAIDRWNGTLCINPGSPTFPLYRRTLGTVGFLSINDGEAKAWIEQLED